MSASHAPIRLMIHGARGRMGARLETLAREDARFDVVAAIDRDDEFHVDALAPGQVDVVIDFSSDQGAAKGAALVQRLGSALLVGTTGLSEETWGALKSASSRAAILVAPNTSLGVAVLNHLVAQAARLLGPEFDIDLIEHHHARKIDAPSGTALRLVQGLEHEAGIRLAPQRIHAVRAGDIIGEHAVQFAGPGERLIITHTATTRDLFVRGALRAATWLSGRAPGFYTIEQTLGLEPSRS